METLREGRDVRRALEGRGRTLFQGQCALVGRISFVDLERGAKETLI